MQLSEDEKARTGQLLSCMAQHVAMVAFLPHNKALPQDVLANGTVSFIQTPLRKLIITNAHVWNEYIDMKQTNPALELIIVGQGQPLAITNTSPISINESRDLAVLACENADAIESIGKSFFRPKHWPLKSPDVGDEVAFVGFPGQHRRADGDVLSAVFSMLAPHVTSVSDYKILLNFTSQDKIIEHFKSGLSPFGPLGGVSGSALYRLNPTTNIFELVGCVNAAGNDLACIYAAKLDCLQADGTIHP